MVEKIIITEKVICFLDELLYILYYKKYFGFIGDAENYIEKLYNFIYSTVIKRPLNKSPEKFQKHGKYYLRYKTNNQTTWYIFFDFLDDFYLINYIINNHSKEFILKIKIVSRGT